MSNIYAFIYQPIQLTRTYSGGTSTVCTYVLGTLKTQQINTSLNNFFSFLYVPQMSIKGVISGKTVENCIVSSFRGMVMMMISNCKTTTALTSRPRSSVQRGGAS